jgi:hypothetical protein
MKEHISFITFIVVIALFFGGLIFMGVKSEEEKFRICIENGNQYIESSCIEKPKS